MKSDKANVAKPLVGKLMKKGNTAAGDPTAMAKPSRANVLNKIGARYGIRVKFQKTVAPEAGATQANGRILPAATKRTSGNFTDGTADHA
jgi:hypothetical protein